MATTTRTVDLARDDVDHIVHPVTAYVDHERNGPLVIVEGKGIWVTDADGKRYLDSLACLWNVNVGHGRTEIGAAMAEQVKEIAFAPSFWGLSNVPAIKLAKRLAEIFPDGIDRFFFTSGGSESNETAFKMARYYHRARGKTEKHKFIARHGGYHGVSYGALSATGIQAYHDNFGPLVPGFVHIPPPNLYQYPEWRAGQPLPAACTGQALEQKILEEGPDTVAAFIAEPVQGVGGVVVPPDEYWPEVRAVCDKYDVLLIADEVITGFGRLGTWFGVQQWNVVPDLMSTAKGITSGYIPLGAVGVSDKVYEGLKSTEAVFMHGFTYNAHPVACAAALANLDIFEQEGLVENAARMGPYLVERLGDLRRFNSVDEIRGRGLMAAVELVEDRASRRRHDPAKKLGAQIALAARKQGLLLRASADTLVFAPALMIDRAGIDELVKRLVLALEDVGLM